jgi:hypothetical protein
MRKRIPIRKRGTKGHFIDQKSLTYLLTFILILLVAALVILSIPEYRNVVIDWVKNVINTEKKPPRPRSRTGFRGDSLGSEGIMCAQSTQDLHRNLSCEDCLIFTRQYAKPNLLAC